jgi:tRNA/rRNA methyltransferase
MTVPHTRFVLIETSHAGNVGATARALKVMGFDDLVLVAPRWANVLRRDETLQRASGALDVLHKARIVDSLDQALDGITHLCATVMTPRDFGPPTRTPRAHFAQLLEQPEHPAQHPLPQESGVAFLFGSERYGMKNADVYRCHVALSIPTNPQFGSLNLASAVQVLAYEWRMALAEPSSCWGPPLQQAQVQAADAQQLAGLLGHWEQALQAVAFLDPDEPKKLMVRIHQMFNRAHLSADEVHILRGVAKAMLQTAAKAAAAQGTHGSGLN